MDTMLPIEMREKARIAYANCDLQLSELWDSLANAHDRIETLEEIEPMPNDYADYKKFFDDCFENLPAHYPAPSVTCDYDKSVIFDAIRGES